MRVVAEFGQTNRGSVEVAISQTVAAAEAGCWAAKWQLLSPERIAADDSPAYWSHAHPDQSQREVFAANGMIDYGAWGDVKAACEDLGLVFLATPFDAEAVEALDGMEVWGFKVASGDITYRDLLWAVSSCGRPVILSTGASTAEEIAQAVEWLAPCEVTLLACDLVYPCPPSQANLGRIMNIMANYDGPVGYSDHTTITQTAVAAAALGAEVLEKHATLDTNGGTPDDAMGLLPDKLAEYVAYAHLGDLLRGSPFLHPSEAEEAARVGARRAWHATRPLPRGHTIALGDLAPLRPCGEEMLSVHHDLIGMRLEVPVEKGVPISWEHLGSGSEPCTAGTSDSTEESDTRPASGHTASTSAH